MTHTRLPQGDPSFAGNGILRCAACNKPLRDHRIRPCPTLGADLIRTMGNRGKSQAEIDAKRKEPAC